ncbi:MAG: S8 family serine peptidase, partial [Candidatus Anammoxibacter sp.]
MNISKFGMFLLAAFVSLNIHVVSFGQDNGNGEPGHEEYVSDEILVKFKDGVAGSVMDRIKKAVGVISSRNGYEDQYQIVKIKEGKVLEVLEKCSKYGDIEYAEPNHFYYINMKPDDEFYSFQWHLPLIHL